MKLIDIVVPHYREPWETGRKFFDLIEHQRGIRKEDIRVTVVQDGEEGSLDWERILPNYSFPLRVETIPHGGVSAARNRGMDIADATWVLFCDFDDCFTSVYSLKSIMDLLESPDAEKYDFLSTPFVIEHLKNDRMALNQNSNESVWTHGKFFRLSFLREKGLRFNETLWYAEDSCFLSIMQMELDQTRKARIKPPTMPLYTWVCRGDSVTMDRGNLVKFPLQLLRRHKLVMEHMKTHDHMESYNAMAVRAMIDMYYEVGTKEVPEETIREIAEFYHEHKAGIEQVEKSHREKIVECSRNEHKEVCVKEGEPKHSFDEWLEIIDRKAG